MPASAPPGLVRRAIRKEAIFDAVGYTPHAGQVAIHASRARHKVAACGRRFGKSKLGGNELIPEALLTHAMLPTLEASGDRRWFWIVGPEYSDSEKEFRVLYDGLKRLEVPFDRPGTYNNPDSGDMHVSLWGGRFVVDAMSAKYPSTLVGEGLSGVIMAEAAKLKESVWTKYIRPTLADFKGWSIHSSTPEGKNWFYRAWQRGQNPSVSMWESWRRPSWDNPIVFPQGARPEALALLRRYMRGELENGKPLTLDDVLLAGIDPEILDMASEMSFEKFNQEIGAEFTEFVGRVFADWDEETHVSKLEYDPRYPLYACCDYGWTNPFVWLLVQVDVWDRVNVIHEYRATKKDINDIAEDLAAHPLTKHVKTLFPDPAEPGDTAVLEKKLRITANVDTGGELKHRLEYIRQALKVTPVHAPDGAPDKRSKLLVDRSCHELIREMDEYRWPETKEELVKSLPEKPMDKDDHGPEALGRFFRGYYGAPGAGDAPARARVRKAR